jgi:hypothetical protein
MLWPAYAILTEPIFTETRLAEVAAMPQFNVLTAKDGLKMR